MERKGSNRAKQKTGARGLGMKIKIDFDKCEQKLKAFVTQKKLIPVTKVQPVLDSVKEFFNSYLICAHCGHVLPDDDFYKCAGQAARRGRYTVCKICYKSYVKGEKYVEASVDNQ
jgi:hypothetical protein